jgi:hypothetical protein
MLGAGAHLKGPFSFGTRAFSLITQDKCVADREPNGYTVSAGFDAYPLGVRLPEWWT